MTRIYLASKSPRRRELLEQINVSYEVIDVQVEETWNNHEPAKVYVTRLAREKAQAGHGRKVADYPVLAADTEVILDGRILGKPADRGEAIEMLLALSGRTHRVLTAVALIDGDDNDPDVMVNESNVCFKTLTREECESYCDSESPLDKAGGYGIQDAAGRFISRIEGSYSGIMGLPLYETGILLSRYHINVD